MSEAVQVWCVPLLISERLVATYAQCLSEDERSRAARFRFEADRQKFVVARGVLRHLLAERLGGKAITLTFKYGEYGKPTTTASPTEACDFHFNLSHSGELALCALGGDRTVGVDIEQVRPIQRLGSMMERCLVDREKAKVTAQPTDQQAQAFLQYWTCKEAYLKAIGLGLAQSMKTVEVDLTSSRLVNVPKDCLEGWQLHRLELPETYVGALVVSGESTIEMKCWQHPNL
ncbi:MAG: 4'-phosphopantetheinyl transferase superfamily protein [Cyanobacteria bacterium P01_D01_bin.1]